MNEYDKIKMNDELSMMEVFTEEIPFSQMKALNVIQSPTNPDWIKSRESGRTTLSYVSGDTVTRMLNKAFNYRWSFYVLDTKVVPSVPKEYKGNITEQPPVVQALGRLVVPGWGIREQWGSQMVRGGADVQEHAFKAAATDAMKKCASMFGIALDLYGLDGSNELMVSPQDFLFDDEKILGDMRNKLMKAREHKEDHTEPQEQPQQPAKIQSQQPAPQQTEEQYNQHMEAGTSVDVEFEDDRGPETQPAPQQQQSSPEQPQDTQTQQQPSKPSDYWDKADIHGLKNEKMRLGLPDNDSLDPYVKEFFGNDEVTYRNITPTNVKDFLHFLSTK